MVAGGIFAKALCHLLSEDSELRIVGDAVDVRKAPLSQASPDLILLDVDGQTLEMEDVIRACRRELADVRVCLLSARPQPEILQSGFGSGANGYVVKDVAPGELIRALKLIASGRSYVDPQIGGALLRRWSSSNRRYHMFELTHREQEVVRLIAQGLSNKGISKKLKLSDKTVKNHVSHIFSKLDIRARSQAAAHAVRTGLI
ncbi:MAG TPA: response regulator transcription factor [Candidatus Babeliales bacterium]|nr:response regulator transcription factor [Candidatus Babeliales bacterium]